MSDDTLELDTKEIWVNRCAEEYMRVAGVPRDHAYYLAGICWEERDGDETPEDAAYNDMECWDND